MTARNERATCKELIEPALSDAGWDWEEQLRIGPGRVNLTGDSPDSMYDETQAIIADYILRYRGFPLAILEAKAESDSAADGMQQASRYAHRLLIRFSISSNGHDWILTDNDTGAFEPLSAPPTPEALVTRLGKHRLGSLGGILYGGISRRSGHSQKRPSLPGNGDCQGPMAIRAR